MIPHPKQAQVTKDFEAHHLDPTAFHHADHVRVAFDLLRKYDFIDAGVIYARGIQAIAAKAGVPQKFNLTITYAFMSLIAERQAERPDSDFDSFIARNEDLMSPAILSTWYSDSRLHGDAARTMFLLPDVC